MFQHLAGRKPVSAEKEDLPASRRRCDSSSHLWPEANISSSFYRHQQVLKTLHCICIGRCYLEDNTGLFQQILRGYGTTKYTTRQKVRGGNITHK